MKIVVSADYLDKKAELKKIIDDFDNSEQSVLKDERNTLKLFGLGEEIINVKSFRVPNIFNQIVYKYFRKSKARRSFEHANKLIKLGIGTPKPIAYFEYPNGVLFGRSYYVSRQLNYDLTYRELIEDFNYPDYDNILRQFTKFTFDLHEKGVEFLDHSPGNTLITKTGNNYNFYLVDLNRMRFRSLNFEDRMKNFARISKYKHMVKIMSDEYSRHYNKSCDEVFSLMWNEVTSFRAAFERKKRFKKKFKIKSS